MLLNELGNFTTFRVYHVPYTTLKGKKIPIRDNIQTVGSCPAPSGGCQAYDTLLGGVPWIAYTHENNPTNSRKEAYDMKRELIEDGFKSDDVIVLMEHPTEFFIKGW